MEGRDRPSSGGVIAGTRGERARAPNGLQGDCQGLISVVAASKKVWQHSNDDNVTIDFGWNLYLTLAASGSCWTTMDIEIACAFKDLVETGYIGEEMGSRFGNGF